MNEEIVDLFYCNRDDNNAQKMSDYMKNKFAFLGIKKPQRAILQKKVIKEWKNKKVIDWNFIFKLWNLPEREFQYLAMDLIISLSNELKESDIENIKKLIVNKSWWDTIDIISSKVIGCLCKQYPKSTQNTIRQWSKNNNLWLVRSAILFQLKYKEETNTNLLADIIIDNNDSNEFFINKAIGWALREYSKTNREWVSDFIQKNKLHPLSIREGSKYLSDS